MAPLSETKAEWLIDLAGSRAALETLPQAALVIDAASRRIVYRNAESRRLAARHGWPEPLMGRVGRLRMLRADGHPLSEGDRPAFRALDRGERTDEAPIQMPCVDGSTLMLTMSATPLRDEAGAVVGAALVYREVWDGAERARLFPAADDDVAAERGRRSLLARIDEAIRDLATPEEIVRVVTHLVGTHLRVSQCYYGAVDVASDLVRIFEGYASGVEGIRGTYRLTSFGDVPRRQMAGITEVVDDTRVDPATRDAYPTTYGPTLIRAFIGVPLVKNGRFVAFFTVNQAEPREWSHEEVRIVEAVAARTWVTVDHLESHHVLRDREAQFRTLLEGIPQFVWSVAPQGGFQYLGPQWQAYTGLESGRDEAAGDPIHPEDRRRVSEEWARALTTGLPFESELRIRRADGEYRFFSARALPVRDAEGRIVQWMGTTTDVHEMRTMREALETRTRQLARAYGETFERLVRAAALRDDDTAHHTGRVGRLARGIADRLGYAAAEAEELGRAAQLHDLGKVGIPDAILHKPGPLDEAERRVMETHTTLGASLLDGGESSLLRRATTIALCHHERWDGGGYPRGLRGEAIPSDGRIVAVADALDAMTSDRPYRRALGPDEARARLRAGRGSQWDPAIVDAFLHLELDP